MAEGPDITRAAALIGDPARAAMLTALLGGQAFTAGELAQVAGVSAPTASAHLRQLSESGLIVRIKQGRHSYVRLAGFEVAEALESLLGLAHRLNHVPFRPGPTDENLRRARICYDHLAGEMGVSLYRALISGGAISVDSDGISLSPFGRSVMDGLGVDTSELFRARRPVCRACLDWSERTEHLAGGSGAALLHRFQALGWLKRNEQGRALRVTLAGERNWDHFLHGLARGETPDLRAADPVKA